MTWEHLKWIKVNENTCPECEGRLFMFGRSTFHGVGTRLMQCVKHTAHAFQQYSDPWRKGREIR